LIVIEGVAISLERIQKGEDLLKQCQTQIGDLDKIFHAIMRGEKNILTFLIAARSVSILEKELKKQPILNWLLLL
jgi:hypothetical protein